MKTIGLIGGMSWESSIEYYRVINRLVREKLGGLHSAKVVMYSFDFDEIVQLQKAGNWDRARQLLTMAAIALENSGADVILICTNTMHKIAAEVQHSISIPVLHIARATGVRVQSKGIRRIGLIGTRFTMEQSFYKGVLTDEFDLDVVVPEERDRAIIHEIIFDELCRGKVNDESREKYRKIIKSLEACGAEGIILGCTEIGLLIQDQHVEVPLFDTTRIHAEAAVEYALAPEQSRLAPLHGQLGPTVL